MKSINIKLSGTDKNRSVKESGRYTAVISQIVDVGIQPGYDGRDPQHCVALVFRLNGGATIVKKVSVSDHPMSTLMEIVRAACVNQGDHCDDTQISDLIGKAVAVEVSVQGVYARVDQVSTLEDFDDKADSLPEAEYQFIDNIESRLTGTEAKAFVMSLHADVRRLLSSRIRQREV